MKRVTMQDTAYEGRKRKYYTFSKVGVGFK